MLPCPTSTRPSPRALRPPSMAAPTSRRPLHASCLEAPARGGEKSAWWREWWQGCHSWHKALVWSSGTWLSAVPGYQNQGSPSPLLLFLRSCHSRLPDGLTRRGDINLLMLGDPGTAKSQLLKFVEKCSPIGVGGLRDPLVVQLVSSFCSLHSTADQTMITADTCPCIHSWLAGV